MSETDQRRGKAARRNPSLPTVIALAAALGAIAIAAVIAYFQIGGTRVDGDGKTITAFSPAVELGGPFELVDHNGRTVTDADFRGQFLLIYFGYTYCPDFCPSELQNMAVALDRLDQFAAKVTPVFISVDPERDTVDAIKDYVPHFHDRMIGLTGSAEQIAAAAKQYSVFYAKAEDPGSTEYLMDHSTFVYLTGPDGKVVTVFRYNTPPEDMAAVIRHYLNKTS